jgi:hypothetical protein
LEAIKLADDTARLEAYIQRVDDENTRSRHELRSEMQRIYIDQVRLEGIISQLPVLIADVARLKQAETRQAGGLGVLGHIWKPIAALAAMLIGAVIDRMVNRG